MERTMEDKVEGTAEVKVSFYTNYHSSQFVVTLLTDYVTHASDVAYVCYSVLQYMCALNHIKFVMTQRKKETLFNKHYF